MSTSPPEISTSPNAAARAGLDVCQALREVAVAASDTSAYVTAVVRILAQRFDAVYGLARMESSTGAREYEYTPTKAPSPPTNPADWYATKKPASITTNPVTACRR